MNDPRSARSGLPNVMLDAVAIGLTGIIVSDELISPSDLRDRFAQMAPWAKVTTPQSKKTQLDYVQVTLFLESECGKSLGTATLNLYFSQVAGGLRLKRRSSLVVNPQKWLRVLLGGEATCGPIGLDENDNVLGPRGDLPALLRQGIALVKEVLQYAADAFGRAVPETAVWEWQDLWIKSAEACRDIAIEDAIGAVRRAQQAAFHGSVGTVRREYEPRAQEGKRATSLCWSGGKSKPEYKVYAKRENLLRLELACRDRTAVRELAKGAETASNADGIGALLTKFAWDAVVEVEQLERHVRLSLSGTPDIVGLLVALAPLSAMAAGLNIGRGPFPQELSVRAARDALGGLMTVGQYDASHHPSGHAIRSTLKRLGAEGGPLRKRMKRSVYSLDPVFAASAEAVMGMATVRSSRKEGRGV